MTPRRHYGRAPALEVAVLLACDFDQTPTEESLRSFGGAYGSQYPIEEQLHNVEAGFTLANEGQPASKVERRFAGVQRRAETDARTFQARIDGLLFSKGRPYSTWEAVKSEAKQVWQAYAAATRPRQVNSLRLRYINQFEFPLPVDRISRYFKTCPVLSPDIPQALSGFALQLNVPLPASPDTLIVIRQATVAPPRPGVLSMIFDIEVVRSVSLRTDDEELWSSLDSLHVAENDVFESSITDATRSLID